MAYFHLWCLQALVSASFQAATTPDVATTINKSSTHVAAETPQHLVGFGEKGSTCHMKIKIKNQISWNNTKIPVASNQIYQRILLSLCLARKIKEKCPEIIFVVGNDIIGFDFLCILFIPTIHNEWAHKEFSRIKADMENVGSKQQINWNA